MGELEMPHPLPSERYCSFVDENECGLIGLRSSDKIGIK